MTKKERQRPGDESFFPAARTHRDAARILRRGGGYNRDDEHSVEHSGSRHYSDFGTGTGTKRE